MPSAALVFWDLFDAEKGAPGSSRAPLFHAPTIAKRWFSPQHPQFPVFRHGRQPHSPVLGGWTDCPKLGLSASMVDLVVLVDCADSVRWALF
jgi:hypothetical protein